MNFGQEYATALELIDVSYQENKELVFFEGDAFPKEFLYALRMVETLEDFCPTADEEVFIAARCQHLFRWEVPRNSYPMDRKGYHQWRTFLYTYQADKAGGLLVEAGYSGASIKAIKSMIEKKNLKTDSNNQLLEDVVCLVFMRFYLDEFVDAHKGDVDKLKRIIKKTWHKMSDSGHAAALELTFSNEIKALIVEAIGLPPAI